MSAVLRIDQCRGRSALKRGPGQSKAESLAIRVEDAVEKLSQWRIFVTIRTGFLVVSVILFRLACPFHSMQGSVFLSFIIKSFNMLRWTIIFLVIALIAGVFGFFGIAAGAASIAKVLFFIFIILFLVSFIGGRSWGRSSDL
jgi:uncharacterized membrane protein YtjA (UPF0391 family)